MAKPRTKIIYLLIFAIMALIPHTVFAAVNNVSLSGLGYEKDIIVSGPQSEIVFSFPLPAGSVLAGSAVNLVIEPSPQLKPTGSLAFYLDERLVSTLSVAQLRTNRNVQLPLVPGPRTGQPLKLAIRASILPGADIGTDKLYDSLYYKVGATSHLSLNFTPQPSKKTTADFFHSLYTGLVIIIPTDPSLEEISAGSWLYGILRKNFPHLAISFALARERDQYAKLPRVWVATRDHLPPVLGKSADGVSLADPETVVVTAAGGGKLQALVRQFPALLPPPVMPAVSSGTGGTAGTDVKRELVYFGNATAHKGLVTVPLSFSLYPAMLAEVPRRLALHLEGRYSADSGGKPVRLDVFFNRSLIHSEVLGSSGEFSRDVLVPKSLVPKTRNQLAFEFHYAEETRNSGQLPTAQLLKASFFSGVGRLAPENFAWNNIGMAFGKKGVVLLEDALSADIIKSAAEISLLINRQLPPREYAFPEFRRFADFTDTDDLGYLFAVGMAGSIPADLQKLPLSFAGESTFYRGDYNNVVFRYQPSADTVIGQVGQYRKKPLIVIAATVRSDRLPAALRQLNGKSDDLPGGTVIVFTDKNTFLSMDSREGGIIMESSPQDWLDMATIYWNRAIRWVEPYQRILFPLLCAIAMAALLTRFFISVWLKPRRRAVPRHARNRRKYEKKESQPPVS